MHPLQEKYEPYVEGMGTLNRYGRRLEKVRDELRRYGITKLQPYWPVSPAKDPRMAWATFIQVLEEKARSLEGSHNHTLAL